MQFMHNQNQLEELNNDIVDDDVSFIISEQLIRILNLLTSYIITLYLLLIFINIFFIIIIFQNETEWQHFLKECIEIIAMVAEIIPIAIFNLVVSQIINKSLII